MQEAGEVASAKPAGSISANTTIATALTDAPLADPPGIAKP
jgi:hypothetical protein